MDKPKTARSKPDLTHHNLPLISRQNYTKSLIMASICLPFLIYLFSQIWPTLSTTSLLFRQQTPPSGPIAASISLPLDHFNKSDTRTFLNRYWVNDTYYLPGGPIFMYDGGEAGISDAAATSILSSSATVYAVVELAKKYHGIALLWEHRFYGGSMPFDVDNQTGVALAGEEAYRYLDNEQALEDAVYLAKNFWPPGYSEEEAEGMRADRSPWVWIGGSYAGSRAAMMRVRNPDVFFASWASSAPVQAQVEMSVYYNPVYQNMPKSCSADVHAAVTWADDILTTGSEKEVELLKRAVWLTNSANPRNVSFASTPDDLSYWNISQILSYPFQGSFFNFQSWGYAQSLGIFCNQLESWDPSSSTPFTITSNLSALSTNSLGRTPTSSGLASSTHSPKNAFYAYIFSVINKSIQDWNMFPQNPRTLPDTASWTWQLCTQFAQFQVSQFPSPHNLVSRFYNITNHEEWYCRGMFPYLKGKPEVEEILRYGGWKMRPGNVVWTNGGIDPWRTAGVQSYRGINPEALDRPTTQEVPKCGESPEGMEVFGAVWEGQLHGSDLSTRNVAFAGSPVEKGLELFGRALDEWLPCFGR
jgi:hypothetical protein